MPRIPSRPAQGRLRVIDDKHLYRKLPDTEDAPEAMRPQMVGVLTAKA